MAQNLLNEFNSVIISLSRSISCSLLRFLSFITERGWVEIPENAEIFHRHRWEKLSPCSIDGSSNMKCKPEMLPFKDVLAFELDQGYLVLLGFTMFGYLFGLSPSVLEALVNISICLQMLMYIVYLNLCCTCTVSSDNDCRFIHL